VVISTFRVEGAVEIVKIPEIPIKIEPKDQTSFNLLVPEKNHSKEGGGIKLVAQSNGY
jgi:hypothetical protein